MAKKIVVKEFRLSVSAEAHKLLHAAAAKQKKTVREVLDQLLADKKK